MRQVRASCQTRQDGRSRLFPSVRSPATQLGSHSFPVSSRAGNSFDDAIPGQFRACESLTVTNRRIVLVNAALLVMSSALASGGDVIPAGWGERAPAAVQTGGCCAASPAPSCCDPCATAGRTRLLDRLRARFGSKSTSCCEPAPACPAATCCEKPSLLERIRSRLGSRKDSCCDPTPGCCAASPCGTAPISPAAPATPVTPPKEMPKPKGNAPTAGAYSPLPLAPLPAARVAPTNGLRPN